MDDMMQRFNRLQLEFDDYKKRTSIEAAFMERVIKRKTEELRKVMEFALKAKRAEYDSVFIYNHKLFDQIHNSIKKEYTRFKEFPEITDKLNEVCEEAKVAVARFVDEKKRVLSTYTKVAKEMRQTQTVLEMPVVNEIKAPDICVLYTSIIEMLVTILDLNESKANKVNGAPETDMDVEAVLSTSDVENFPDSVPPVEHSPEKSSSMPPSIEVLEHQSAGPSEPNQVLKETEKKVPLVEHSPEESLLMPPSVEVLEHQSAGPAYPSQVLTGTEKSSENCAPLISVSGDKSKRHMDQKLVSKLCVIFPDLDEAEIVNYKNDVHRSVSFHGKRLSQIVDIVKKYILNQKFNFPVETSSSEADDKESCSSKSTKRERESRIVNIADAEKQCTICLESGVTTRSMTKLGCGHSFHGDCIKDWMEKNHSCPNCRAFVLPYDEYPKLKEKF